MNKRLVFLLAVLAALAPRLEAQVGGSRSLVAFRSDRELADYLRDLAEERQRPMEATAKRVRPPRDCGSIRVSRRGSRLLPTDARAAIIRGQVVDEAGTPISGAAVRIDSLGLDASTGDDGRFALAASRERLTRRQDWTVSVRRLGYGRRERVVRISPGDSVEIAVKLCTAALLLQEAVTTGMPAYDSYEVRREAESVTNTQHAGVDEGGIVKVHGNHLVILRRGRLFTVRLGDDMRPVSMVNAFGPGIEPRGAWYDELLISGNKVVVVGYSYASHGTEIGIFRIDDKGELRYDATYHLRSNDYYSSRNYASRLLGTKLVFYTPQYLWYDAKDPLVALPAMRKWEGREGESEFKRIVASTHVYRPAGDVDPFDVGLHTVTICDLAADEFECEATALLGPSGRVFYVSPSAVYAWLAEWHPRKRSDPSRAMLYRMPLDGSSPKALRVSGSPVDQFSFLESEDGYLNVVVRDRARGDAMWQPERTGGEVALLRIPLESFGDGRRDAPQSRYRDLPIPSGSVFVNRFVGRHLLYGTGNSWGRPRSSESELFVVPWSNGEVTSITLPHGTDRIEPMGGDAVVIGTDGRDLHFTGVRLDQQPEVALRYRMANAAQGELRSHGFFYKPDGPSSGILGLPIREGGRPGYEHLWQSSAAILFLRNSNRRFVELGKLEGDDGMPSEDACVASCVDWYGNARPVFIRGRILALLGYELVEGRLDDDRIREIRRVSFAPPLVRAVER
jgi:hypothetical protein